jgi:glutathione S-transferase
VTARPEVLPTALAVHLRHSFDAPRGSVFRAWTDPEVLRRWWCPPGWAPAEIEVDLRVGGTYRIGMRQLRSDRPVYVRGAFLEVDCPQRLVYTWHWQNAFEGMSETRVTVLFTDTPTDGTDVVLTHENLPEVPLCLRHCNGWKAAWPRIDAALVAVPAVALGAATTKGGNRWGR